MNRLKRASILAMVVLLVTAGFAEARGRARRTSRAHPRPSRQARRSLHTDLDRVGNVPPTIVYGPRVTLRDTPGDDTIRGIERRKARVRLAVRRTLSGTGKSAPPLQCRQARNGNGGSGSRSIGTANRGSGNKLRYDEMDDTGKKKKGNIETE